MRYVQYLLYGKLDLHRQELAWYKSLGEFENVDSCLAIIAEIELALKILNDSGLYI